MGKRRTLNGLPNSLVEKYLSTLMRYGKGYMACWIWEVANEKMVRELEIDIMTETTLPATVMIQPIVAHLGQLRETISKTLSSTGFEAGFIVKAKFNVSISKPDAAWRKISCQGIMEDINGRVYKGKVYHETAYPIADSL